MCYLAWPTLMSYLRMTTHPRIFAQPLSPTSALQNIQGLLALPHVRTLSEGEGFFDVYQEITHTMPVRGNLVPDAHLAPYSDNTASTHCIQQIQISENFPGSPFEIH